MYCVAFSPVLNRSAKANNKNKLPIVSLVKCIMVVFIIYYIGVKKNCDTHQSFVFLVSACVAAVKCCPVLHYCVVIVAGPFGSWIVCC